MACFCIDVWYCIVVVFVIAAIMAWCLIAVARSAYEGATGDTLQVYRFTSEKNGAQANMFVRNGLISWQSKGRKKTEWHGEFDMGSDGWITMQFHCRAELDKLRTATVWPVGYDLWAGFDESGTKISLELMSDQVGMTVPLVEAGRQAWDDYWVDVV